MTRTTIVVAGLLRRDGRLLIGQRQEGDRHALKWEFPGGKVEQGETPREALRREMQEELGIEVVVGGEIARYEHAPRGRAPLLLLFHRIESFTGEPVPSAFKQIVWEEPGNLPQYDFLDGDQDIIRRIVNGRIRY